MGDDKCRESQENSFSWRRSVASEANTVLRHQLCSIFSLNFVVVDWCRGRGAAGGVTSVGADSGHPGGKRSWWFSQTWFRSFGQKSKVDIEKQVTVALRYSVA